MISSSKHLMFKLFAGGNSAGIGAFKNLYECGETTDELDGE